MSVQAGRSSSDAPRFCSVLGRLPQAGARHSGAGQQAISVAEAGCEASVTAVKKVGRIWSARVSLAIRALAAEHGEDFVWFWIGDHREYERLIRMIKKG